MSWNRSIKNQKTLLRTRKRWERSKLSGKRIWGWKLLFYRKRKWRSRIRLNLIVWESRLICWRKETIVLWRICGRWSKSLEVLNCRSEKQIDSYSNEKICQEALILIRLGLRRMWAPKALTKLRLRLCHPRWILTAQTIHPWRISKWQTQSPPTI